MASSNRATAPPPGRAAAQAGKSVLHVDSGDTYGSHWGTQPLSSLLLAADSQPQQQRQQQQQQQQPEQLQEAPPAAALGPAPLPTPEELPEQLRGCEERPLRGPSQQALLSSAAAHGTSLSSSEWSAYNVDLAGKVVLCSGLLLEALLGCSAHHYLEFKLVHASYVWRGEAEGLQAVPASRADVFRERTLPVADKRALMRFLKAAADALQGQGPLKDAFDERPFVRLLEAQELPRPLRDLVLHALALVDEAQEGPQGDASPPGDPSWEGGETEPQLVSAAQGLKALGRYLRSMGKYGQGTGPFLLPLWGLAELAQAFCRAAAVKGALYVLRCPLAAAFVDPQGGACRGVRTASGQVLSCRALAGNEEALTGIVPRLLESSTQPRGVSRAICATDEPLQPDEHQVVAVFPPWAPGLNNPHAIRVVQASWQTKAAPEHRYVLYFSTPATQASSPEADLRPAVSCLLATSAGGTLPSSPESGEERTAAGFQSRAAPSAPDEGGVRGSPGERGSDGQVRAGVRKPRALLELYYRLGADEALRGGSEGQQQQQGEGVAVLPGNVAVSGVPDASVSCDGAVESATRAFRQLFPDVAERQPGLFPSDSAEEGDDSDTEATEAIEGALKGVG